MSTRHPHAGIEFTDDDAAIAAALEEVSIPTLMAAMVHVTGDPSWIRGDIKPAGLFLNEYQGFMDEAAKAEVRRRALPALIEFRDRGCVLPEPQPDADLLLEMMNFLACAEVPESMVPMMLDDMALGDPDPNRIEWGDALTTDSSTASASFNVVVIGAGESGVLAALRLKEAGLDFTVFEKNGGPGGTWYENRYPGARVDVGSHFYCYSFEPSDHWTEYFSQQPELQRYFERVVDKHELHDHMAYNTEVTAATYDDATKRWTVSVSGPDGDDQIDAAVVISAVGSLNRAKLPDIDGMDDFAGPSFHSTRWQPDVDLTGKRVVMVGAGATGFQIAPTIADEVEHLTVFQRTPQWMIPNPNYHEPVPEGQKWAIRHLPFFGRWFRFLQFFPGSGGDVSTSRIDPDYDDSDGLAVSERNRASREWFSGWMREQIGDDPELLAKVIPNYPATGKRTLQDNGSWLRCLTRDNVELNNVGIDHITADGVVDNEGVHHDADVIIYATGFHANRYLWPMTITGRDNTVLSEQWGDRPSALLGITVPNFPNFFCMYGPGTNLASGGSLIFHSECQITYIMSCLHALLTKGGGAMEPTQAAHDDYLERFRAEISQMVWSHWSIQHSHYKNDDGDIYTLSPWPLHEYQQWTKHCDEGDYDFVPAAGSGS